MFLIQNANLMMKIRQFLLSRRNGYLTFFTLIAIAFSYGASRIPFFSSASANSTPLPDPHLSASAEAGEQTAVFAGGCFWGMEAVFEHLQGVSEVVTGYTGGNAETANYPRVSGGGTDHAESVQVTYDPSQISYDQLLKVYFSVAHDPTQLNRQGPDQGTQYRSAIFFSNAEQQQVAQAYIEQLNNAHVFAQPIVTTLEPLTVFYAAEDYHQDYIDRHPQNPYVVIHDLPKLAQLQTQFPNLYKR